MVLPFPRFDHSNNNFHFSLEVVFAAQNQVGFSFKICSSIVPVNAAFTVPAFEL
jgi:hypothetical protein